ncbi:MAG: Ig-like domain-containing protein, partial [Planctomycetota bacterium]|nr:Ig-like domain-containing protein [Planctomycetota bacterium]
MKMKLLLVVLTAVLAPLTTTAAEPLKLASVLTDNAVLQRGQAVPVWGRGEPGRTVVVKFASQEKSATVAKDGKWMVRLDELTASAKGQSLSVTTNDGSESVAIKNVMV